MCGGWGSVKGRHTIVVGSSGAVCWWGGQTDLLAPSGNGTVPCVQFRNINTSLTSKDFRGNPSTCRDTTV